MLPRKSRGEYPVQSIFDGARGRVQEQADLFCPGQLFVRVCSAFQNGSGSQKKREKPVSLLILNFNDQILSGISTAFPLLLCIRMTRLTFKSGVTADMQSGPVRIFRRAGAVQQSPNILSASVSVSVTFLLSSRRITGKPECRKRSYRSRELIRARPCR